MDADRKVVRAEELRAGDVIEHLGQWYSITSIEPYVGPFSFVIGIARSGDWGISLESGAFYEVAR